VPIRRIAADWQEAGSGYGIVRNFVHNARSRSRERLADSTEVAGRFNRMHRPCDEIEDRVTGV
jgi:hypothetical protein